MDTTILDLFMAADASASSAATNFLNSAFGKFIVALGGAVGLLVAVVGLFKSIGKFINGRVGEGFKVIAITVLLAGILFSISSLPTIINWAADLVGNIITTLSNIK